MSYERCIARMIYTATDAKLLHLHTKQTNNNQFSEMTQTLFSLHACNVT